MKKKKLGSVPIVSKRNFQFVADLSLPRLDKKGVFVYFQDMPKIKFKRSQSYNLADNSFLIHVQLLDNSFVDFSVPQDATGGDCLERVARYLNLKEVRTYVLSCSGLAGVFPYVPKEMSLSLIWRSNLYVF